VASASHARAAASLAWGFLAFAAIHGVVDALQPWFFRIAAQDGQWTVAHVAADLGDRRADVVFMGSSRAANAFDPGLVEREVEAATGGRIRAVNLAVTGANADTCRLLLKNLIGDARRPRVIVYGLLDLEMLAPSKTVRQDLPYISSIERLDDFHDYAFLPWRGRAWFLAEQSFPVERDRRLIRDALDIVLASGNWNTLFMPPPGEQGFHRVSVGAPDPDPDRARREYGRPLSRPRFHPLAPLALERFLDLARQRAIEVVLVDTPVTASHRSFWRSREDLGRYLALVRQIAERHRVPLVELYENPNGLVPDDRGFSDTHHLNELGAAIVSHEVVERELVARFRHDDAP
jgi:hypothetical protein